MTHGAFRAPRADVSSSNTSSASSANQGVGSSDNSLTSQGSRGLPREATHHVFQHHAIYAGRQSANVALSQALPAGVTVIETRSSSSGSSGERRASCENLSGSAARGHGAGSLQTRWADTDGNAPTGALADQDAGGPDDALLKEILRSLGPQEHSNLVAEAARGGRPEASGLARFWSVGSAEHAASTCRECDFAYMESGCRHGADCEFCHMPHPKSNCASAGKPRPCKPKRMYFQAFQEELMSMYRHVPGTFMRSVHAAAANNPPLQQRVQQWIAGRAAAGAAGGPLGQRPGASSRDAAPHIMSL
mmetsp:Transcript_80320/g.232041  ORF Transcript_80320/g.232041 Transcript_80320/m.232041 type:complete len:305 (+) Transcript_80320:3-917(+)